MDGSFHHRSGFHHRPGRRGLRRPQNITEEWTFSMCLLKTCSSFIQKMDSYRK
uniref:Uncharacterized protein n=1 Tax=Setaria italica TaxID=4555 RepID=K4ANV2_SETIT